MRFSRIIADRVEAGPLLAGMLVLLAVIPEEAGLEWLAGLAVALAAGSLVRLYLRQPVEPQPPSRLGVADFIVCATLLVVALAVRTIGLANWPPGPNVDEGINGHIVMDILEGNGPGPLLRSRVVGEEAGTFYLHAFVFRWLGGDMYALRLPTAIVSAILVPLVYLLARLYCGLWPALLSSLLLCFDSAHLCYSRIGNSVAYAATFEALALLLLWAALNSELRRFWVCLGMVFALAMQTYPVIRLLPFGMGTMLALHYRRTRRRACPNWWHGPAIATIFGIGAIAPFFTMMFWNQYFERMRWVTVMKLGLLDLPGHCLRSLADLVTIVSALRPFEQGFPWLPCAMVPVLFLGGLILLKWLAGEVLEEVGRSTPGSPPHRPGGEPPAGAGPCNRIALLAILLALGVLPPLLVTHEPASARRYILLLAPAYVLIAIGMAGLFRLCPRRLIGTVPRRLAGSLLALAMLTPAISSRVSLSQQGEGMHESLRLLNTSLRLARDRPLLLPRGVVRYSFLWADPPLSPAFTFLLRAFPSRLALGLNPFPLFPPSNELNYAILNDDWLPALRAAFPGGHERIWLDRSTDTGFRVYTVAGEEAWGRQGLMLKSTTGSGQFECVVPEIGMRGVRFSPGTANVWTGAIYVPNAGYWTFRLAGRGRQSLEIGRERVQETGFDCLIQNWFSEGWHSLCATSRAVEKPLECPELTWAPAGQHEFQTVPRWNLLQRMPELAQLRARPLAPTQVTMYPVFGRCFEMASESDMVQDILERNGSFHTLHSADVPLLCFTPDGAEHSEWRGLRYRSGERVSFRPEKAFAPPSGFWNSMAPGPADSLLLVDAPTARFLVSDQGGRVTTEVVFDPELTSLAGVAYDDVNQVVLVADTANRQILRVGFDGRLLPPFRVGYVTGLCFAPGGGPLYAVAPQRGGILKLSRSGEELDFWRTVDVTELSRIACDTDGRLYVLTADSRLLGYTPRGEVLCRQEALPREPETNQLLQYSSIRVMSSGALLLGIMKPWPGWVVLWPHEPGTKLPLPPTDFHRVPAPW